MSQSDQSKVSFLLFGFFGLIFLVQSHYVVQARLKKRNLPSLGPECWNYMHLPFVWLSCFS